MKADASGDVPVPTAKQLRQLEKRERRKKYADLAIQGTNNSSITSKRSVEKLYLTKLGTNRNVDPSKEDIEYFKYFVSKPFRRSPCINRGYWLRIHAIKSRIDCILAQTRGAVCIVNLGCGYDPLPFQLLDPENVDNVRHGGRLSFIDLDYNDLIHNKIGIICRATELVKIVGQYKGAEGALHHFEAGKYMMASCDMNDQIAFKSVLKRADLDHPEIVKIFIAEVSLAYMEGRKADEIVSSCSAFPNSHFLMLEQLLPAGPHEAFSRQMLRHFIKNDSPLQTVTTYPTLAAQKERFETLGFPTVNHGSMFDLWNTVDENVRRQIEDVEVFDELEEFLLFCHHYMICHGTNSAINIFPKLLKPSFGVFSEVLKLRMNFLSSPSSAEGFWRRKFGASAVVGNKMIYAAGCSNARRNDISSYSFLSRSWTDVTPEAKLAPRMCHTLTALSERLAVMIGGRGGPSKPCSEVWLLKEDENDGWHWIKRKDLPEERFRHEACALNAHQMLIYGGVTEGPVALIYDLNDDMFYDTKIDDILPKLISPGFAYDPVQQVGAIVGGQRSNGEISDELIVFECNPARKQVFVKATFKNSYFSRFGSKALFVSSQKVLIGGGVSPWVLFDHLTTFIEVNIATGSVALVEIPPLIWKDDAPMLVGFEMQKDPTGRVLVFGGGAVCYGFGAVWNRALSLDIT
ncbi:LAMI_0C00650g1_1 [Lachancea mirantina]|uniref:tRNA wybutosine-synthesizing protein 4 n=1 Tax=Lachancea mirantina TaxID=1230905 RepID=A0A1G4IZL6_9SACH|nr:LAMI_0C00650g1_1 [Lachancea mirantina]